MAEAKIEFILYKKEDKSVENEKKPNPPIHLSDLFKSTAKHGIPDLARSKTGKVCSNCQKLNHFKAVL